tara:strand:- start:95 stop:373 length:279 start_codon:yes stop_codon:yes gene_type:complete
MNKSKIIDNLSSKSDIFSADDIEKSIHTIIKFISESLAKTNRVEIRNFGTFSTRKRQRRISRNPKTGTSILVEAKFHPYFRASKYLKESLNK